MDVSAGMGWPRITKGDWLPSRSKSVTSNGFGFADPPAGLSQLCALAHDCCAIARLRSVL
jgi:hypothetical protein